MINTFERYIHLERIGNDEVQGIEFGECWIFPKLDGTNGSIWYDGESLYCGSRNRTLPKALANAGSSPIPDDVRCDDNQGFAEYVGQNRERFLGYFREFPDRRLYGEWLVPHAFKGYRDEAWRRFYVFDVSRQQDKELGGFLPYNLYKDGLEKHNLDYIVPQCTIINPTYDRLLHELKENTFLCKDGSGPGEGIVIKNYGFRNQYGRQIWGKLVSNEYKELHTKFHGVAEKTFGKQIEERIVDLFVTEALVEKEYYKIVNEMGGWNSRYIPRLLHTVFHTLVVEEIWEILRKLGTKITINFGALNALTTVRIKEIKKELF